MINSYSNYNKTYELPPLYQNNSSIENFSYLPKLISPFPKQNSLNFKEQPLEKRLRKMENIKQQEKLLKVLQEQTELMEKLMMKYKNKNESRMEIYDKKLDKFSENSEKIKETKINYHFISERIDQKFKEILDLGIESNPYYPYQMPYMVFRYPKKLTESDYSETKKKKKKKKKRKKTVQT